MPTTKVVDVIDRASIILQDATSVRFPQAELLKFFNDAQKEVVLHRPDASMVNTTFACATGSKQTLPAAALRTQLAPRTGRDVRTCTRGTYVGAPPTTSAYTAVHVYSYVHAHMHWLPTTSMCC